MSESENRENKATGNDNNRNPWLFFGGLILLGVALALLIFGSSVLPDVATINMPQVPAAEESAALPSIASGEPLKVGDRAYTFTLNDVQGNPISLTDFRGQPVIVNFWATWCAPCRLEMPEFQELHEKHQEDGLVILALNQAEAVEDVADFFSELGLTFTTLMDEETAVSEAYGAINLPSTYFINANGEVTAVHRGILTSEQAEEYLTATIQ